jgi:hypothetical protein
VISALRAVRLTTSVALAVASLTVTAGRANWKTGSLSVIVRTAVPGLLTTVAGVTPVSVRRTVRLPSKFVSFRIGTLNVLAATPGGKVKLPLVSV